MRGALTGAFPVPDSFSFFKAKISFCAAAAAGVIFEDAFVELVEANTVSAGTGIAAGFGRNVSGLDSTVLGSHEGQVWSM